MTQHDGRALQTDADLAHVAHRVAEIGRETASKSASYLRDGVERAAGYAQEIGGQARDRISDVTGRPPEVWARQLRQFVEDSPYKALVAAIAAGYLLGRAARRG